MYKCFLIIISIVIIVSCDNPSDPYPDTYLGNLDKNYECLIQANRIDGFKTLDGNSFNDGEYAVLDESMVVYPVFKESGVYLMGVNYYSFYTKSLFEAYLEEIENEEK